MAAKMVTLKCRKTDRKREAEKSVGNETERKKKPNIDLEHTGLSGQSRSQAMALLAYISRSPSLPVSFALLLLLDVHIFGLN